MISEDCLGTPKRGSARTCDGPSKALLLGTVDNGNALSYFLQERPLAFSFVSYCSGAGLSD